MASTGADLLWRIKKNAILPCERRLADGSYFSRIDASAKDRRHDRNAIVVRVIEYELIEYELKGIDDGEPLYRLTTSVLDAGKASTEDLAGLYYDRCVTMASSMRFSKSKSSRAEAAETHVESRER